MTYQRRSLSSYVYQKLASASFCPCSFSFDIKFVSANFCETHFADYRRAKDLLVVLAFPERARETFVLCYWQALLYRSVSISSPLLCPWYVVHRKLPRKFSYHRTWFFFSFACQFGGKAMDSDSAGFGGAESTHVDHGDDIASKRRRIKKIMFDSSDDDSEQAAAPKPESPKDKKRAVKRIASSESSDESDSTSVTVPKAENIKTNQPDTKTSVSDDESLSELEFSSSESLSSSSSDKESSGEDEDNDYSVS